MQSSLTNLLTHGVASVMAILEYLLRCFRRRSPASDQKRPLCTEEDSTQDESTDDLPNQHTSEACQQSVHPSAGVVQDFPSISAQHDSTFDQSGTEDDSSSDRTDSATLAQTATAAQLPTPVLKGTTFASVSEPAKDTSPPLELRTRNVIARTPPAGPSPASATPASAAGSAGALPFSHSTPQSTLHQAPSDSGMSTPSVFGLPEFMLEGDYTGMQTPHIVGMNNPTTAFKENKQLRRHETPFDTRVEHLMEKERIFRERFVQNKSSQGSDRPVQQRKNTSSGAVMLNMLDSPNVDVENAALSY